MATAIFSLELLISHWGRFLDKYDYKEKIRNASEKYPDVRSAEFSFDDISQYDPNLGEYLLEHPDNAVYAAEKAMWDVMAPDAKYPVKFRVKKLPNPVGFKLARLDIRDLSHGHIGKLVAVEGIVRKKIERRPKLIDAVFRCARCGLIIKLPQEDTLLKKPFECSKEDGGCGRSATQTMFKLILDPHQLVGSKDVNPDNPALHSSFIDHERIEIQEIPEGLRGGDQPQRLSAVLEDDLTGRLNPGDRVILNGILRGVQTRQGGVEATIFDWVFQVNSFETVEKGYEEIYISQEDEQRIRELAKGKDIYDKLEDSICPAIYGMGTIKRALALQLFGGVEGTTQEGRGRINILLIGDPGTGKSVLLRFIASISPRGIFTSGKGTSAAGLTAAATRDEHSGRWSLEAGALVLADQGYLCVDEIEKISDQDRSGMHEAMEQGCLSLSKAGIVATLNARTTILAAGNPEDGRFDEYKPVGDQINLPPTLLSRFDAIFSLKDKPDKEKDAKMARHILTKRKLCEVRRHNEESGEKVEVSEEEEAALKPPIEPELLKKYIAHGRKLCPIMSPEVGQYIEEYFVNLRQKGEGKSVPITARQLEALVRLSEASAKIRLSDKVERQDAERAVEIMAYFLSKFATEDGKYDIDKFVLGQSTSMRERVILVRGIVAELSGNKGHADGSEVLEEAERRGIDRELARTIIAKLKEGGTLFEPIAGRLRISRMD